VLRSSISSILPRTRHEWRWVVPRLVTAEKNHHSGVVNRHGQGSAHAVLADVLAFFSFAAAHAAHHKNDQEHHKGTRADQNVEDHRFEPADGLGSVQCTHRTKSGFKVLCGTGSTEQTSHKPTDFEGAATVTLLTVVVSAHAVTGGWLRGTQT